MLSKLKGRGGFTLIELLVVIAILSILLVIVLVAINPARQTRDARNKQRLADVLTILNSVNQHFIEDDSGDFPSGTPSTTDGVRPITSDAPPTGTGQTFCEDLTPEFIAALPFDPSDNKSYTDCTNYDTGYTIERFTEDRIKIAAPGTEGGIATISAIR